MKIINVIKDSFNECAPFNWGMSLFSYGCNLHCKMCEGYNYETITNKDNITCTALEAIDKYITPMHDCVIFIGGEPTIWGDKLKEALKHCHDKGLKTKIFTNGMLSNIVKEINSEGLCDSWSVDYKGIPEKISEHIGTTSDDYRRNLYETINNIIQYKLPLEIRTTIYKDNEDDYDIIKEECSSIIKQSQEINGEDYFIKWIEQHDMREYLPPDNILRED